MKLKEHYKISELLQLSEASQRNEFKPKFGKGAERNSSANEKAVGEILKNTKEYNDKARKETARRKNDIDFEDFNKTTMDVRFEYDPGKAYKERVRKLATTGLENDKAECYSTEGNEKFYKDRARMSKNRSERDFDENIKGIVGRNNHDHGNSDKYKSKTPFMNENSVKRLKFKNTVFLSENQVLKHVPDDYRFDGSMFHMQDMNGSDYIVECKADQFGVLHTSVSAGYNRTRVDEELGKMNRLAGYRFSDDNVKIDKKSVGPIGEDIADLRDRLKTK